MRERAGSDGSPVCVDGFEDAQVVGQMDAVAAEAGEDALRHAVAVGDRCAPGLVNHLLGFREERFRNRDDTSRRDAQPPALGFEGEAREKRAVAHEHGRLPLVQPGHDRLERQVDGEEMPSVVAGGERLAERRRDVRRAGGRHDADDAWDPCKVRVSTPVASLEAHVRRIADRPRVPPVDVHTSRAGRAAGGDDLELVQQMVPRAAIEVVFTEASGKARVGHDRVEVVHQIGLGHHRQIDDGVIRQ